MNTSAGDSQLDFSLTIHLRCLELIEFTVASKGNIISPRGGVLDIAQSFESVDRATGWT